MSKSAASAVVAAFIVAGCQTVGPAGTSNRMLLEAGFVARKPTTSQQMASFQNLPPNAMVRQTVGSKVNYVVADPAGCGCVYVGSPAAFRNYKAMQNTILVMTQQQPGALNQLAPGLSVNNIEDLGTWAPM